MSFSREAKRVALSVAFLALLVVMAWPADDRGSPVRAIALGAFVGLPFVILSLIDWGKALRRSSDGNFRGSLGARLLSHFQAGVGAICMAAGAYAISHDLFAWYRGAGGFSGPIVLVWIISGAGLVAIGFVWIWSAFASGNQDDENK